MIYLYIKQHKITQLKYFGMTTKNPFKYGGSGTYWKNHINKYDKSLVNTIEVYGFDCQQSCSEFALKFSRDNDIVESKEWANLIDENGSLESAMRQVKVSTKVKEIISKNAKINHKLGKYSYSQFKENKTDEHKAALSESQKKRYKLNGNPNIGQTRSFMTEEIKTKIGNANRGKVSNRKGIKVSEYTRKKISEAAKNRKRFTCQHCSRNFTIQTFVRYHGDKCKLNQSK